MEQKVDLRKNDATEGTPEEVLRALQFGFNFEG